MNINKAIMTSYLSFKFSKIYLNILSRFNLHISFMHSVIINLFRYHISSNTLKNDSLKQIHRNFQILNLIF